MKLMTILRLRLVAFRVSRCPVCLVVVLMVHVASMKSKLRFPADISRPQKNLLAGKLRRFGTQ